MYTSMEEAEHLNWNYTIKFKKYSHLHDNMIQKYKYISRMVEIRYLLTK